jgi:hypothetical protein
MRNRLSHPSVRVPMAIFVGGLVHNVLPLGMFGPPDLLFRALLTGAAAGLFTVVLQGASRTTP